MNFTWDTVQGSDFAALRSLLLFFNCCCYGIQFRLYNVFFSQKLASSVFSICLFVKIWPTATLNQKKR